MRKGILTLPLSVIKIEIGVRFQNPKVKRPEVSLICPWKEVRAGSWTQ